MSTENNSVNSTEKVVPKKNLTFLQALVPFALGVGVILACVGGLGMDSHVPMCIAIAIVALFGKAYGHKWEDMLKKMLESLSGGLSVILILLPIGAMIGTYIASGAIPYIIYMGLKIISPQWFLLTACVACAVLTVLIGSSWSAAGTLGVALMGIAEGLGIPLPMAAGAILCGCHWGDKQSPVSDTTNFAPAIAETTLYRHMYSMLYTTTPPLLISFVIFAIMGLQFRDGAMDYAAIESFREGLAGVFNFSPLLLVPFVIMIVMIVLKMEPILVLSVCAFVGGVFAIVFQGMDVMSALNTMMYGFSSNTGIAAVDSLLTRGGLYSMMYTISIVLLALPFGGLLQEIGVFHALIGAILKRVNTMGGVVTASVFTNIFLQFATGELFTGMMLTGRGYAEAYDKLGLDRNVLSRTMEDGGSLFCTLCPWNPNGAFMASTLGVACFAYAPYMFLSLLTPIFTMICAFTGFGMFKKGYYNITDKKDRFVKRGTKYEHG